METGSREISKDSVRAQARMMGLDIDNVNLDDLVARLRFAMADVDGLDELGVQGREPAVRFGRGTESDQA